MQPERLVCPIRLADSISGTLVRKTTAFSQCVKCLFDNVLLGFVEPHEDATDPIFFRIKPATFSAAHQLCR